MKFLLLLALMVSFSTNASLLKAAPSYFGEDKANMDDLDCDERWLELSYDFASTNAASGDSIALSGSVPADYSVTQVAVRIESVVVSASDNTIALDCESSEDLLAAVDLTDKTANSYTNGAITALSGAVYSDGCTPTMTIGAGVTGITSGKPYFKLKVKSESDNCLDDE